VERNPEREKELAVQRKKGGTSRLINATNEHAPCYVHLDGVSEYDFFVNSLRGTALEMATQNHMRYGVTVQYQFPRTFKILEFNI